MQPERGVHDPPHHQRGNDQKRQAIVIEGAGEELDLVVLRELQPEDAHARHPHAAVAAGQVIELEQEGIKQHAEGEREHAEEDAHVADAEEPDRNGGEHGAEHHGREHQLEGLDPEHAREESRAIGAGAEKHRMPEGEEPGIAEEEIEAEEGDGVAEERDHQRGVYGGAASGSSASARCPLQQRRRLAVSLQRAPGHLDLLCDVIPGPRA